MNKTNIITVKNAEGDPDTQAEIVIQNKIDYKPKVSVIIPIYNVEEYLRECLDSVINQTLKEIEIICVDDGSTDSSLEILKEYAKRDDRFTIITQENLHAGVARNAGLSVAKGEYIHFLDSDDWIELEMLEKVTKRIAQDDADICVFVTDCYNNKNKEYRPMPWGLAEKYIPKTEPFSSDDINNYLFNFCQSWPWNKLFKHSFLTKKKLYFQSLARTNDLFFVFMSLVLANRIVTEKSCLLHYRINLPSSLQATNEKTPLDWYYALSTLKKQLEKLGVYNKYKQSFVNLALGSCQTNRNSISNNEIKEKLRKDIKNKLAKELDIYKNIQYSEYFYDKERLKSFYLDFIWDKKAPKVSLIMPCYNTAPYLRQALDSAINQTLKEIEIICVNDGSTDNTLDIIKEYAAKDNRIVVIDGSNGGYGKAMNKGLDRATGEYIGILEPDDFIDKEMYELLYNKIKSSDSDFVKENYNQYLTSTNENKLSCSFHKDDIYNKIIKPLNIEKTFKGSASIWSGIYKKLFLKEHNIRFNETPGASFQDTSFWIKVLLCAQKAIFVKDAHLHYRVDNQNSSVKDKNKIFCIVDEFNEITRFTANKLTDNQIKIVNSVKLEKYNWNLNRLEKSAQRIFIEKTKDEILHILDNEKYTLNILPVNSLENIKKLYITKISVIIPVYNTEKYLRQCLDSVINQTLKDIEIICINDGSPDNSLQILQEYAAKDERIIIIDQKNQGLSCSRNNALKIARGKYIQFLDSDDWLRNDTCEIIYESMEKNGLDIFSFSSVNYIEETGVEHKWTAFSCFPEGFNNQCFSYKDCISFLTKIIISSCRNVYNRLFLEKYRIKFPEHLCFEDNMFFLEAFLNAKKCGFVDEILYFRRVHSGSITQNWDKLFSDYLKISDMVINYLIEQKMSKEIVSAYKTHYLNSCLWRYNTFNTEIKSKYTKDLYRLFTKYDFFVEKEKINPAYNQQLQAWYRRVTGQYLDLDNPQTFNEKIQWMKLYDSTPIKTQLADKYLVRDWVKDKIGKEYLIPLLGAYDYFDEIDFDKLPNRFVIKCNHGCGYNIIVKDKSKLNLADTKTKLDKWMSENFAFKFGFELHYRDIKPKIIIEQYIENKTGDLIDYKFWCFNGKVEYILYCAERNISGLKMEFYDRNWNRKDFMTVPSNTKNIDKPTNLEEMIKLAEILSKNINFVRVDFYSLDDGTIYFGEMTFTPTSGTVKWKDEKVGLKFGQMISLPNLAYNIDTGEYYEWYPEDKKVNNINEKNNSIVVKQDLHNNNNSPLLFKDIGLGCNTWCSPISLNENNGIKKYTYDLTDNIYTRYVSWDPIKEGSCDVEIIKLSAVEKRSKKVVAFPITKIVSNGKIIGNKVEFRNQRGCWIGCTIEGAYENFTIEARIKNI